MDYILKNTSATLSNTFYVDETPTDATGNVSVTVYKEDGTELVASTTATHGVTGVYSTILAPQANCDILNLKWTGTFGGAVQTVYTEVEVIGGFIASVAEIRAQDSLSDTTKYPLATIRQARAEAQELFENYCGRSFTVRYARDVLDGDGTSEVWLRNGDLSRVIEFKEDGTALNLSTLVITSAGRITRASGSFSTLNKANLVIRYEHGMARVPADLKRAFLTYVRYVLLDAYNRLPDRTLSYNADGLYVQLAQASANRPTGLPEVDSVLIRYQQPTTAQVGGLI